MTFAFEEDSASRNVCLMTSPHTKKIHIIFFFAVLYDWFYSASSELQAPTCNQSIREKNVLGSYCSNLFLMYVSGY